MSFQYTCFSEHQPFVILVGYVGSENVEAGGVSRVDKSANDEAKILHGELEEDSVERY